jgi:Ca-activated chloride channel family protein
MARTNFFATFYTKAVATLVLRALLARRLVCVLGAALCAVPLAAQQASPPPPAGSSQLRGRGPEVRPDETGRIRVNVHLVQVPVTVEDPYGRLVIGLDRQHFRIFENKVEQEIAHFSREDVPISIAVILDISGSMANKHQAARQAAQRFMRTANPEDEFLVVAFSDRAELFSGFTGDIESLQSNMLFLPPSKGRTALYDGVYLALSQMRDARHPRKALLIISDGGDNHSRYNYQDVRNLVRESETQIYGIGIFDPWSMRGTLEELHGPMLLSELAELTGGRSFTVERLGDLPDIAAKIGLELRNQYMIGYRPANPEKDGKWRKIKVKLQPPSGLPPLRARARTGYKAPGS